jgi:DNA processing protein
MADYMSHFPKRLGNIYCPPHILYMGGNLGQIDEELCIAIVGTRKYTEYGKEVAFDLGYNLAREGVVVISGLARGIDTVAIQGALDAGGKTVAVLGCGVNVPYPPENANLMRAVAKHGAVISEYPPFTEPYSGNFPQRNRIISGLSLGVVVAEAPQKSGALITASFALDQGRDVFAIPGNVNSIQSEGANRLLYDGARMVRNAQDILLEYQYFMPLGYKKAEKEQMEQTQTVNEILEPIEFVSREAAEDSIKKTSGNRRAGGIEAKKENQDVIIDEEKFTKEEKRVVELLLRRDMGLEEILQLTQFDPAEANSVLTMMEMNGFIDKKINKQYSLIKENVVK